MSCQKGNTSRTRPPKYRNRTVFRNDLHGSVTMKCLQNQVKLNDLCDRCKAIVEWKIKYKKYKPLTALKKCNRCDKKVIRHAYRTVCDDCSTKLHVCPKCGKAMESGSQLQQNTLDAVKDVNELEPDLLRMVNKLPERKRRTFVRMIKRGKKPLTGNTPDVVPENDPGCYIPDNCSYWTRDELVSQLEKLSMCHEEESEFDLNLSDMSSDGTDRESAEE